jgi:uncharacterized protein involved in outer membrane biogenesis
MKKFFIIIFVLIVLSVGALAVFVITFDANRYKDFVIEKLEDALGSPVTIDSISLGFWDGLSLQLDGLAIYRDRGSMDKPAAALDRAKASVRLLPLLSKKLEISAISLLRPQLNIIKEADGRVRVDGVNPKPAGKPGPATTEAAAAPVDFLVNRIRVEDGQIGYLDRSSATPTSIRVRDLDILLKNISLKPDEPVDFEGRVALFGAQQNFDIKGRVRMKTPAGPYLIENVTAYADLNKIDLKELAASIKDPGLRELQGRVDLQTDRLVVGQRGISDLDAQFILKDGRVRTQSFRSPIENLNIDGSFTSDLFRLRGFSAILARGQISATGESRGYLSPSPSTSLQAKIDGVMLQELLPERRPDQPQVHGRFSAVFGGNAAGFSWPQISQTLNGQGEVALAEGAIININILRMVFDGLSKIPGVEDTINAQLPARYRQTLSLRDTFIQPVRFPVTIVNGVLMIPNIRMGFDGFELFGRGQISMAGAVNCEATLVLAPDLSAMLLQNVPQIQYIADPNGNLAIPVKIIGSAENLKVLPDMNYVLSRVLATKGSELIGDVLQKGLGKGDASSSGAAASGESGSIKNILAGFLQ